MSDEIDINSIERFSKRSDRLILEELSSCEVPAGCGGLVLRWLSNEQGLPVSMRIYWHGDEAKVHCNGKLLPNGCGNITYGDGVLAIYLSKREHPFDWFFARARHTSRTRRDEGNDYIPEMNTSHDGSWKFSTEEPANDWMNSDFDDAAWETMQPSQAALTDLDEREQWQFRWLDEQNVPRLSIPHSEVWIRKLFDVSNYAVEDE